MPQLASNKHALHEYEILEKYQAGIVLTGNEVKSIRGGHLNLKGSYATIKDNEIWLINASISPYKMAYLLADYSPTQSRKLLLNQREIERLKGKLAIKGLTLVPLSVYTTKTRIKVELGLARGRQQYEKREVIKKREQERALRQLFKKKTT